MADSDAPTVGELLRRHRLESGLDVKVFAERTRIRRTYLEALENNRFDLLPGEAYLLGFLRVYAGALGLSPEVAIARYHRQARPAGDAESAPAAINVIAPPPAPIGRRRSGSWTWLSAVALVGAALALASLTLPRVERPSIPGPAIGAAPPPSAPEGVPSSPAPDGAFPAAPLPAETATDIPSGQTTQPAVTSPPAAAVPPVAVPPSEPPLARKVGPVAAPIAAPANPAPTAAAQTIEAAVAESGPPTFTFPGNRQLRLQVLGPNEVEIHSDGRPPQRYTLTAPAVLSWRVREQARVRIENPAAARVWLDEKLLDLDRHTEFFLQAAATAVAR